MDAIMFLESIMHFNSYTRYISLHVEEDVAVRQTC
jgi:hypothetical protein